MMNLTDLINRTPMPAPWAEGDNIPWHDPGFSARMLKEHLSQEHDAASRRADKIDRQVEWIHRSLLRSRPARILDLGCGPGLYAARLAARGHACYGVDYSPASISHALRLAEERDLDCHFQHADIRAAEYGTSYGLAMLIFGEFNVFSPADARLILRKARAALAPGGLLLLEPNRPGAVEGMAASARRWYTEQSGLFSDRPYVCLEESLWDKASRTTATRFYIIDADNGEVTRYAQTMQEYSREEYAAVLTECGFGETIFHPSLIGEDDPSQSDLIAITARA
jgi:SAM-dependent methyltransferase